MDAVLLDAARQLALTTAKKIRQPVDGLVRRPRTQRYFLKALRVQHPDTPDDALREAITALEVEFPPKDVDEPIGDPVWTRRAKRLLRLFKDLPAPKIHELVERARKRFGWHHELTVNALMCAEMRGAVVFDDPFWHPPVALPKPRQRKPKEVRTMVSQAATRRKEPVVRVVDVQRVLPCQLTTLERGTAIERTGELMAQKDALESELREMVDQYRAKIRAKQAELDVLRRLVLE